MRRIALLPVLVLVTAACAPLTARQVAERNARTMEICVGNETAAQGNLQGGEIGRGSMHRFDVMSGQVECERFERGVGSTIDLYLETIGGGMWGPTQVTASVPFVEGHCWFWRVLNNTSVDAFLECSPRHRENEMPAVFAYDTEAGNELWSAFTQCDRIPTSWLNVTPGIEKKEQEGMIRAHETAHRIQIARFGSCAAWKAALASDPRVRVEHEAEAHCEAARHEYEAGRHASLLLAMIEQAQWFSWYFWKGDVRPALDAIAVYCKP